VDVLCSLGVPFLKIGSGDANNFPLLQHAATKKIPLVVSTGKWHNGKDGGFIYEIFTFLGYNNDVAGLEPNILRQFSGLIFKHWGVADFWDHASETRIDTRKCVTVAQKNEGIYSIAAKA
jgi:hypothetical protein